MKYIKTFENIVEDSKIVKSFASYVIDNSNLKSYEDGFTNYSIQDYKNYSDYYTYYFRFELELFGDHKKGTQKLITFLKSINAKSIKEKLKKNDIEISFDIKREDAKLYTSTTKYNI